MIGLPRMDYKGGKVSPVQFMILVSIRKETKYGYEIIKDLKEVFKGVWEPKTGVIYPAIKKLQEMGILDSDVIDDKEYYTMTEDGKEWLIEVLPMLEAMSWVGIRLMTLLIEASEDFDVIPRGLTDIEMLSKDEKQKMILEVRNNLERDLMILDEMTKRMAGREL